MSYALLISFLLVIFKLSGIIYITWWWIFAPVPITFALILIGKLIKVLIDIIEDK